MKAGVILAAGDSSRMGFPKQLAEYKGKTILDTVIDTVTKKFEETVVVLGHENEPLLALESLDYANLLADYLENQAEAKYLEQQLERDRQLVEKEISPQRTLDRAEADFIRASTKLQAAKARLSALGITADQFDAWENNESEPNARLTLYSPIEGTVNQHLIDLGTSVNSNQKMLDIVNKSKVLVRGFVSPEDATLIQSGTQVEITQRNEDAGNEKQRG